MSDTPLSLSVRPEGPPSALADRLQAGTYAGYAYAYPHKTSYRALQPPADARSLWADEDKSALFLYVHVPFCEMRCGFCNLFTTIGAEDDFVAETLSAMHRQSAQVAEAVGPEGIAVAAFGGGTPSYLSTQTLPDCSTRWLPTGP